MSGDQFLARDEGRLSARPLPARETFSSWVNDRAVPHLSTNAGAAQIAFQEWRRFKEAFAPELIARAVDETTRDFGRPIARCSDPFGGSGTTALASQFLGIHPTTIEVNPFLADLIEAKLTHYDPEALEQGYAKIVRRVQELEPSICVPFPNAPPTFVEPGPRNRFLFWADIARRVAAYRDAIAELESEPVRRFFRVMLGSISVAVSNVVVSGKGRRYRKGWRNRKPAPSAVDFCFNDACLKAIYEVRRHAPRPTFGYDLLRGDSRKRIGDLGDHDLSVFSPPYPNSFDYTDVYNIELWVLGYLDSPAANRLLREQTLRSHVQIHRSFSVSTPSHSGTLAATLSELENVRSALWNKRIPDMIAAYFADMRTIIGSLRAQMSNGGRVYIVVGDSRYAGIDIPVANVLKEEAAQLGYHILSAEPFRSMRASPQQGGRPELAETLLTLRTA